MVRRLDARAQGFAANYAALIGARGAHVDAAADAARAVIEEVRRDGIAALLRLTAKFDGLVLAAGDLAVTPAEINAAFATLRSPAKRLRHWLELEGVPVSQFFPDATTMSFFGEIAEALQRWRELREAVEKAPGHVARVVARGAWMKERPALERLAHQLVEREHAALSRVREWDAASGDVKLLAVWAGEMAFLERWNATVDAALAVTACGLRCDADGVGGVELGDDRGGRVDAGARSTDLAPHGPQDPREEEVEQRQKGVLEDLEDLVGHAVGASAS
jgi:hypothetical protein